MLPLRAARLLLVAHALLGCVPDTWVTVSPRDAGAESSVADDAAVGVEVGACPAGSRACDDLCVAAPTTLYRAEDDARDAIGEQHAVRDTALYAAGRIGRAFSFGGARAPRHVELPAAVGNFGTGDFSIALWFNTTNRTVNSSMLARRAACWGAPGFAGLDLRIAYNGRLFLEVWTTSGEFSVGSLSGYNDGEWHHVAIVREGGELHLAVDGAVVGSVGIAGSMTDPRRTPTYLGVGRCVEGAPGSNGSHDETAWFEGRIDEVGYFDRALTAQELDDASQGRCSP